MSEESTVLQPVHDSESLILDEIGYLRGALHHLSISIDQIGRDLSAVIGERVRIEHRLDMLVDRFYSSHTVVAGRCVVS